MRAIVIAAAVVAVAVVVVFIVDAILAGRVETQAADSLRADVAQQTGAGPEQVEVELQGLLPAVRLATGPAPDLVATLQGVGIAGGGTGLTELRIDLEDVDADLGELLGAADSPFTARSGTFVGFVTEEDLNENLGQAALVGNLDIREGVIVAGTDGSGAPGAAPTPAPPPADGGGSLRFTAELGERQTGDGPAVILRPDPDDPGGGLFGPLLADATLTIPLALPDALIIEELTTEEDRLVGRGRVDVDALTN